LLEESESGEVSQVSLQIIADIKAQSPIMKLMSNSRGFCTKSLTQAQDVEVALALSSNISASFRLFVQKPLELESMTPYLLQLISESSMPLKAIESDFAADSCGFATGQFSRWFDAKYGEPMKQHEWIKVHLMCGVKTNIVTSVEVSGARANDTTFLKPLLETTTRNGFQVKEVSADKGKAKRTNPTPPASANSGSVCFTSTSSKKRSSKSTITSGQTSRLCSA
jgi:hypothetical protein